MYIYYTHSIKNNWYWIVHVGSNHYQWIVILIRYHVKDIRFKHLKSIKINRYSSIVTLDDPRTLDNRIIRCHTSFLRFKKMGLSDGRLKYFLETKNYFLHISKRLMKNDTIINKCSREC